MATRCICRKMTRPMTGQPATDEELTNATQNANAELSKMLESGEIERGFNNDEDEKTREEKLEELREFKDNNEDLYDGLEEAVEEAENSETEMAVTENGETQMFTREEWEARRGPRMRTWKRMERDGTMFVRVARWFNDEDVNKVQTGRGFYGHKVGESEKALKFEVSADDGKHNAETETVWVPKKAVRTHELK